MREEDEGDLHKLDINTVCFESSPRGFYRVPVDVHSEVGGPDELLGEVARYATAAASNLHNLLRPLFLEGGHILPEGVHEEERILGRLVNVLKVLAA